MFFRLKECKLDISANRVQYLQKNWNDEKTRQVAKFICLRPQLFNTNLIKNPSGQGKFTKVLNLKQADC